MGNIVEMKNISKRFGEIQALKKVDFTVRANEIVGLVGDNGSGKTTLIKILTGVCKKDEGTIYYKGEKVDINSPAEAIKLGIEAVHQRGALIDGMSIKENFFLGREIVKKYGPIRLLDDKEMREICMKYLNDLGLHIDSVDRDIATLSGGERQAVAIGRCMYFGGELLVLDEPTTALSIRETEKVLEYVRNAKKMGRSVIFISHLIRHVYPVVDRFVVLDRGKKIGDFKKSEISREELEAIIVSGRIGRS